MPVTMRHIWSFQLLMTSQIVPIHGDSSKIEWLPSTISVRSMMGYLPLLLLNHFIGLCSSQLVQPRRLIERILALHENSNRLIAREDSMSLYVDISEANKYPSRDDLHKRVFNKDRNVSVCDWKWQNLFISRNCSSREIPSATSLATFVSLTWSGWSKWFDHPEACMFGFHYEYLIGRQSGLRIGSFLCRIKIVSVTKAK